MTKLELKKMVFEDAVSQLLSEVDTITTYETLKEFAIAKINDDHLFLAIHILEAINRRTADFYDYDYCMGTLDTPTPLFLLDDLEDYCDEAADPDAF